MISHSSCPKMDHLFDVSPRLAHTSLELSSKLYRYTAFELLEGNTCKRSFPGCQCSPTVDTCDTPQSCAAGGCEGAISCGVPTLLGQVRLVRVYCPSKYARLLYQSCTMSVC